MSATYDPTLPTGRDWVRFLSRDTDVPDNAELSDEEIDALLAMQTATEPAAYYYAAAEALALIVTTYAKVGKGLLSKSVEHLELTWGSGEGVIAALEQQIAGLRKRGAFLLSRRPRVVRAVGRSITRDTRFPVR